MPFGLMNALATFQRMMDVALKAIELTMVYGDGVVIFWKVL